ncbi:MAG: putative serine protease PepD [Acidimicrobiaceae bacterium]
MSEVDWESIRPPTWPAPEPPVSDAPSWAPITAPVSIVPPPPPPPPPPFPPPSMGTSRPRRGRRVVAAVAVSAALLAGGFAFARSTEDSNKAAATSNSATIGSGSTKTVDPNAVEPIAAVAAAVSPAVVQIETRTGLGSGFVYDTDGHILTAAHVVEGAGKTVNVRLADGSVHKGEVIGADNASDVAVVKIDPVENMQVANLALGIKVEVGQTAVAIGSPFGLDQTVTAGIVSAVDRPQETPGGAIDMYQIDAPINPGNSGGPVADRQGRVFGMSDSIITQTGENVGVGFLVPIDLAKAVADKLVAGDPVEFAFLGVSSDSQTTSLVGDGAIIVGVTSGSPADKAGLQEGDRVTAVDSAPVRDSIELGARVRSHQPGDSVHITFVRDGETQTIEVVLGSTKTK